MSVDLSAFVRAGSRDYWMLGDSFQFAMKLPATTACRRVGAQHVQIVVTRSLTVQVLAALTGRELGYGEFRDAHPHGRVSWISIDKVRMCRQSAAQVEDYVRRALHLFARGIINPMWLAPGRARELRHVA